MQKIHRKNKYFFVDFLKLLFNSYLPLCKHDNYVGNRKYRGLFVSAVYVSIGADINGCYDILKKCKSNAFADGVEAVVVQPMVIKTIKHIQ